VLFSESDSGPILALAKALDRRRASVAGAPTQEETTALATLTGMLSGLDAAQRDLLLSVAVVVQVLVIPNNAAHRVTATSILETSVVAAGEGAAAFDALQVSARRAAIARRGRVLREWRVAIVEARLHLRADAEGGQSAQATAADGLLDRYREALVRSGTQLDLMPLGISIEPIPLSDPGSSWEAVVSAAEDRTTERDLGAAIQRRGRVLLLGAPGAGKSSALAQVAGAWAADDVQPIPILVSLEDLASAPPTSLLHLVKAARHISDSTLLAEELTTRLLHGEAALFLDGLDECRDRRFAVIAALREVLRAVDPGSDVVLSTRDVAYGEAKTLGWIDLPLAVPGDMDEVLEAIARALADSEGLSGTAHKE
jgi:hypothetical protein